MNRYLIALIFLSVMITSGCAANQPLVKRSVETMCVDSLVLAQTLVEYGEKPALTMTTNREMSKGVESFATVLFVNYQTKSWTLVEQYSEDLYCVIGMGNHLTPYQSKDFF
jgi:hypothetical protein